MTVADVHVNAKRYVGTSVEMLGMSENVHSETKMVNGVKISYTKLTLYEVDAKGHKDSHYIYVSLPTSNFTSMPVNAGMARME